MKEKKNAIGIDLTKGSILKKLLIFASPIVLTNLIQQFYSMVDLAVIGRFAGSIGSVGVSVGGEAADLVAPVAMGFSTAGQIYIAQLSGAKMNRKIRSSAGTLITIMMIISLICMALTIIFTPQALHIMNCPPEAFTQAKQYMLITALGFPFIFGYNAVVGILRGMGESKRPMYFVMIAAMMNIVMDILLVAVIPLQAAGTAIATVLSQFASFLASFIFMYRNRDQFDFELTPGYFRIVKDEAGILVRLAVPQVIRSVLVRISMLWVNANVNQYGLIVSAANSIGTKIQKFLEVFVQGIDTAAAAMVGQNLGAKDHARAGRTIWVTLACCELLAGICCFLSLAFPDQIYGILTRDPQVIVTGRLYLKILCIHFVMSAFTSTFQAMVTGSGFVSLGFALGILDGVICRIGISLFFYHVLGMGYVSFWWGTALARVLTGLLCFLYFMSGKWKHRKLLTE